MTSSPPVSPDLHDADPDGASVHGARGRVRHRRHLATTARLHALRAQGGDEPSLLRRTCELLLESFAARSACIRARVPDRDGARYETRACARKGHALCACAPLAAWSGPIGEARVIDHGLALEVALADGDRLLLALVAHGPEREPEDALDELAHLEEFGRVMVDVIDADRNLARLRRSETELRSILGALPDILAIVDRDGRVLDFHNGDDRHVLARERFVGRHLAEIVPPDVWRAAAEVVDAAFTSGRVHELRYDVDCGGRTLHLVSRGQAFGEPRRVLWHTRDVTDERRLQERLLSVQRFEGLGLLASGLAHDFSNLLTAILGNAELARVETAPGSAANEALGDAIAAARRASDLCQQLLAIGGRGRFTLGFVNLSLLCDEVLGIVRASIDQKLTIVRELAPPEGLPLLIGDAVQLRQIVLNLVSSSAEAMGRDEGVIVLRTGVAGDGEGPSVYLEAEDSGPAFDRRVRQRLDAPFVGRPLESRELALAATFGIVRAHGGAFEIDSGPLGGTRVRVLLPLDHDFAATTPIDAVVPASLTRGGLVLVVTSDGGLVNACRRALEHAGHRVQHVGSGEEAAIALRTTASLMRALVLDRAAFGDAPTTALDEITRLTPDMPRLALGFDETGARADLDTLGRSLARLIAQL